MVPRTNACSAAARFLRATLGMGTIGVLALAGLTSPVSLGCRALEPSNKPVEACRKKCELRASRACSDAECERGCEFILDRLVERESDPVIACVARGSRRCTDVVWADCATRVGVHADGGPPAPPPPAEDWE